MALPGFHLVPLAESRGLHPNHPRAPERRLARRQVRWMTDGLTSWGERFSEPFDPMAYQAREILRAVLTELREDRLWTA